MSIHQHELDVLRGLIGCAGLTIALGLLAAATFVAFSRIEAADDDGLRLHWAFRPIRKPAPPLTRDTAWVKGPIDAFVLRKLEDEGLCRPSRRAASPCSAAPASTCWACRRRPRRSMGSSTTPAPTRTSGCSTGCWPRRTTASGGVVTGSTSSDTPTREDSRPTSASARPGAYRDYVIRSIGADKPFDRFIREQVAGDELWPDDPDAALGSAMYSVGPAQADSAMVSGQLEYDWLTDAADTTGEAFLGLTMGCARCHDHKYDPIRQADYFALQAIFAASDRPYPENVRVTRIKALNGLLAEVPLPKEMQDDPRCTVRVEGPAGPRLFHRDEPIVVRRLHRGELGKPLEAVEPAFPAADAARPRPSAGQRRTRTAAGDAGRLAHVGREPDRGTGAGQPGLGLAFRAGDRAHAQRFRQAGRGADASRAPRLPGRRADGTRLEPQAPAPAHHALERVPDVERGRRRVAAHDPEDLRLGALPPPAARRRRDPRRDALLLGTAQLPAVRQARRPAAGPRGADGTL